MKNRLSATLALLGGLPLTGATEIDTPYTFDSGVPYYEGLPWSFYGSGAAPHVAGGRIGDRR